MIKNFKSPQARPALTIAQADEFSTALIDDPRLVRSRYFDGRFLQARDLVRDQTYFLNRQADLGRALGLGVAAGLEVTARNGRVEISSGYGFTPSGKSVLLEDNLTLDLNDTPEQQRLNAVFGLTRRPSESPANRTGFYILTLRAVEYEKNLITSYPTTVNGPRGAQFGDIAEAVAVTLVPYAVEAATSPTLRRAQLAASLLVDETPLDLPVDALPLALLALNRGVVDWADAFLVRREVARHTSNVLSLGITDAGLREAFYLQHRAHFDAVVSARGNTSFAARDHFLALPPAGRFPAGALNSTDLSQSYFPPEIDAQAAVVPRDELAPLLTASLALPPIDLRMDRAQLETISVAVLLAVPRSDFLSLQTRLSSIERPLTSRTPKAVSGRTPKENLMLLMLRRDPGVPPPTATADAVWREAVTKAGQEIYFVRRPNVPAIAKPPIEIPFGGLRPIDLLGPVGGRTLIANLETIRPELRETAVNTIANSGAAGSQLASALVLDQIRSVAADQPAVEAPRIAEVVNRALATDAVTGLRAVEEAIPAEARSPAVIDNIILAGVAIDLNKVGLQLKDKPDELREFSTELARATTPALVNQLVARKLQGGPR